MKTKSTESERQLRPLHTWRSRLCGSSGPADPVTRHVLLTLSLHMNELGESCFPSVDTLAHETALSEKTVRTHLKLAVQDGWIVRRQRDARRAGQGWRRYEYRAGIGKDAESATAPSQQASQNQQVAKDVRSQLPHVDKGAVTDAPTCGNSRPKGAVTVTDEYSSEYSKRLSGKSYRTSSEAVPETEDHRHLKRILQTPDEKLSVVDRQWKRKYLETASPSS